MKKIYLIIFFLILAIGIQAQSGTYTANGVTWKYELNGNDATITGETQGAFNFSGELKIPNTIIIGGNNYPVRVIDKMAFFDYRGITGSLNIPSNVTSIGEQAFYNCNGFTGSLIIPDNVNSIGKYAFASCTGFTGSLVISNSITNIEDWAFVNCMGLTGQLVIPNSVTTIGESAFQGCMNFTGLLTIPSSVTKIDDHAFQFCHSIGAVTFEPGSSTVLGKGVFASSERGFEYVDVTNIVSPITQVISREDFNSPFQGIAQNKIIYLPNGSATPVAGQENFVLDGVCDKFVVYDRYIPAFEPKGSNYNIQHPFTATTAVYYRDFTGGNPNCKTICLPYPGKIPAGMKAYEFRGKAGSSYFRFVSISGTELQANKPYLLQITDGNTHYSLDVSQNVNVPVTPATIEVKASDGSEIYFGGTTVYIDNAPAAAGGYYNLDNNTWKPIKTDNPNGYVHSFRAYIRSTSPTPAKGFAIVLDDENETTGIDNAEDAIEKGDGKIYSLDGKLLGTDINALKSGEIYIKNGKKFYKF